MNAIETDPAELRRVAEALRARRLVLLLGQSSTETYVPRTAQAIRSRLSVPAEQSLPLWWLTSSVGGDQRFSTLKELSDHAVVSDELIRIAELPWNAVLTSAFDSIARKALEVHPSRQLQPVFAGLGGTVLRASRAPLTFAPLFGSVDRPAADEQPPLDRRALQERRVDVLQLLDTLHEVIGPNGVLIIDGWAAADWLRPRDLAPRLFALAAGQVHLFSADDALTTTLNDDEDFQALLHNKIVISHSESLGTALFRCVAAGLLEPTFGAEFDDSVHEVTLRTRGYETATLRLDSDAWVRLSRHFVILDDSVLVFEENRSITDQYAALRNLLRTTQLHHHWKDVRLLAFRRRFSSELERTTVKLLESAAPQETTLVIVGQAGSGKSIALAQLALDLRARRFPVLYVPPSSILPDWNQIDAFCNAVENASRGEWVTSAGARPHAGTIPTAVIWDGLRDPVEYLRYSEELASRGRRVLIIGSSYYPPPKAEKRPKGVSFRSFKVDVSMDEKEQSDLIAHFGRLVPSLRRTIEEGKLNIDANFLVALYRLLPDTREPISDRLLGELRVVEERLKSRAAALRESSDSIPSFANTALGEKLWVALRHNAPNFFGEGNEQPAHLPDWMSDAQRLLAIVMCAGQHGIAVPQELALRCLGGVGERTIHAYREATREDYSIIVELEAADGSIDLRPRHPLEAQEIMRRRHSNPAEQLDLVRALARALRESDMVDEGNANLESVVRLLRQLGPRGRDLGVPTAAPQFWPNIADVLRDIRLHLRVVNPRLLLLEAHIRREWVIQSQRQTRERATSTDDVNRMRDQISEAEEAVRSAIAQLPDRFFTARPSERRFASTIHTELACVLGARQRVLAYRANLDRTATDTAEKLFGQARAECREARMIFAEYASFDAEFWITRDYLRWYCKDETTRPALLADLAELLDEAEQLELPPEEALKVEERRHELAELWSDKSLSEKVLARIDQLDPATAAVLRARAAIGTGEVGNIAPDLAAEARSFLEVLGEGIYSNRRALLLYTRLWWISKTGVEFFAQERLCLPFGDDDWRQLVVLMSARLRTEVSGYSAFALFHRAWAHMQIGDIRAAEADFMEIGRLGAGISRRVRALAVLSDNGGEPQKHQAEVRRVERPTRGFLWLPRLGIEVAFNPLSFELNAPRRFQAVGPVHIVMNYRGLYAENPSLFTSAQQK